jgi:hypothetical protein
LSCQEVSSRSGTTFLFSSFLFHWPEIQFIRISRQWTRRWKRDWRDNAWTTCSRLIGHLLTYNRIDEPTGMSKALSCIKREPSWRCYTVVAGESVIELLVPATNREHSSQGHYLLLFYFIFLIFFFFSFIILNLRDEEEEWRNIRREELSFSIFIINLQTGKWVLVSTVNSCPTFLSWGWWCTKGKGKVILNHSMERSLLWPVSSRPSNDGSSESYSLPAHGWW